MDAAEWDARYRSEGLLWTAQPNRFLVAEVADLPPGDALDVGAGEGRNAVWLATKGWRVTAVDHSQVGLDKARQLAADAEVDIELVLADVTDFTPDRMFDLVAILYLHLPAVEMAKAVGNVVGALAPGGRLVVVGHHPDNIEHGVGGPQLPEVLYLPEDIAALLGDLDVTRAERVERPVEHAGITEHALDTLVAATKPAP